MITIVRKPSPPATPDAIRRPRQKRSQDRFEAILNSAARLLETHEPEQISIYTLAEEAGLSPPSIYHFFPDASQVFVALAERYFGYFLTAFAAAEPPQVTTWQQLMAVRFGAAQAYYNAHPAARRILLGSGLSAAIRARDLEIDRQLAQSCIDELCTLFIIPEIPALIERFTELLVINDALWTLSVHRHGFITDAIEEQARRAREAYTRTFLPEYLVLRVAGETAV